MENRTGLEDSSEESALNVIYIVLDDLGYSALGCYGSEIETPHIDSLARNGLRYNNFTVTPLCSPTRACLLTGRNCHSVGVGIVTEIDWGPEFPNKRGRISDSAATLAEMLKLHGIATYMVGKWHLVPGHETSSSGPFENWPLSKGFQRYYGFLLGMTDQFAPDLVYDNHRACKPYHSRYHLSEDLLNKSIEFLTDHISITPDRPFFLYLAFGAQHEPHQVPKEFIDKYEEVYDKGWDQIREERFQRQKELGVIPPNTELVGHNPGIKGWDELTTKEKELFIKFQQTYAGFLTHTDQQVGRLLEFLQSKNKLDNTIIVLLSDNGGSQEGGWNGSINDTAYLNGIEESVNSMFEKIDEIGGPKVSSNYPKGWAQVCNTPFKFYKQDTFYGGTHVPLIIHCPQNIRDPGSVRSQFYHAIDITPTILDLLNIEAPKEYEGVKQMPLHGVSMKDTFTEPYAPSKRKVQYFEMLGHRAIWQDGWVAVTYHEQGVPFAEDNWELYNTNEDFSQKYNLAKVYPWKVKELQGLWWEEAVKYGVLPLNDNPFRKGYEGLQEGRTLFTFYPNMAHLPTPAAPNLTLSSYSITIPIYRTDKTNEGVLIAHGGHSSGYTIYIKDNYLFYEYYYVDTVYTIQSSTPVPVGYSIIQFDFIRKLILQGTGILSINQQSVGSVFMTKTFPFFVSVEGLDVGRDRLTPVSTNYPVPEFPFSGQIEKVVIEVHEDEFSTLFNRIKEDPISININGTIRFL
ncbi:arylsulfatase [Bacillus sp. RG28]|uniref:Arylsulfatase n=1 Tax=Gottfriedia endophytica TaxID=2820819 RepID=A0A940NLC7_9BACI|nr:arylsulfatase [Gottfriedia endophytica]MBP0723615.1 arylsulfatase [Gottfriedia endophytica]